MYHVLVSSTGGSAPACKISAQYTKLDSGMYMITSHTLRRLLSVCDSLFQAGRIAAPVRPGSTFEADFYTDISSSIFARYNCLISRNGLHSVSINDAIRIMGNEHSMREVCSVLNILSTDVHRFELVDPPAQKLTAHTLIEVLRSALSISFVLVNDVAIRTDTGAQSEIYFTVHGSEVQVLNDGSTYDQDTVTSELIPMLAAWASLL